MSVLIPNSFSTYELTDQELEQGSMYTITQKQVLQNHLAVCAEEKIALELNTSDPQQFIQQEAYKRGQMDTLRYLLEQSEAIEQAIADMSKPPVE